MLFSRTLYAVIVLPYFGTLSNMHSASVEIRQRKQNHSIGVCLSCIVDEVRPNRMIGMPVEGISYKYRIFGTEAQLGNVRSYCETAVYIIKVTDKKIYVPRKGSESANTALIPLKPQESHKRQSLKVMCLLHTVSGQCKLCLTRAVREMEFMYSSIVYHPTYNRRVMLTVIVTRSVENNDVIECNSSNCNDNLFELNPEVCRDIAKNSIEGDLDNGYDGRLELKRKRTGDDSIQEFKDTSRKKSRWLTEKSRAKQITSITPIQFDPKKTVTYPMKNEKFKLPDLAAKINDNTRSLSTHCMEIAKSAARFVDCVKYVLKMTSSTFVMVYQQDPKKHAILYLLGNDDDLIRSDVVTKLHENRSKCTAKSIDLTICREANRLSHEYPVRNWDTIQHTSICVAAKYHHYSKHKCLTNIQVAASGGTFKASDIHTKTSLISIGLEHATGSDTSVENYNKKIAKIVQQSKSNSKKCLISVYSSEVCEWHTVMMQREGHMNLNIRPQIEYDASYETIAAGPAMWPPCENGTNEEETDPMLRYFVAVKLLITSNIPDCFDCIAKFLEVFFIHNTNEPKYIWMTQIRLVDLHGCFKEDCAMKGILYECTRHPPAEIPLAILSDDVLKEHMTQS